LGGQISSKAFSAQTADGGTISLAARELRLDRGSEIVASNEGDGDAGAIEILLGDALYLSGSEITTRAISGSGGKVTIVAPRLVDLLDSRIETRVSGGLVGDDGGNIEIDPRLVALNRSSILATAVSGDGGDITITADELLSSADSVIDASSQLGVDGDVVIRSPAGELIEGVAPLQADLLGAADLLRRGCTAQRSPSGTLTVAPRVVRIGPDGVLEDAPGEAQERCEKP
jgi:large exoprotein involved in heme utilization and adhesion